MTQYLVFENPSSAPGAFKQKQVIINVDHIKYIEPIDPVSFKLQLNNGGNIEISAAVAKSSEVIEKIRSLITSSARISSGKILTLKPDFIGQWTIDGITYNPPSSGGGGVTGSGASGDVTFWNGATSITGDSTTPFYYTTGTQSGITGRLGLGTSSPNFKMDISGGDLRFENNDGIRFGGTGSNNTAWRIYTTGSSNGDLSIGNSQSSPYLTLSKGTGSLGQVRFDLYGSGTYTGTAAYDLSVDASGNIIETATGGSGGSGVGSTIDYTLPGNGYEIRIYIENATVGSPDFGQAYATPQLIALQRQTDTLGEMPFNLFYNKYTPALDPGYDGGGSCGSATMCMLPMLEESTADINALNSGTGNQLGSAWQLFTQDAAALNSYRMPLRMRIDNGGASPGNGTIRMTLIKGSNSSPNPVDDATALPSTVSVYFRDTTLTTSKMGRPPFNLLWAGADTQFAKTHNAGAAYTNSLDYVFTGNSAGDINRKYELFFQDEYNAYNRCSYLKVTDGRVVFQDLPTADPVSKGVLWNDAGTLKISLG